MSNTVTDRTTILLKQRRLDQFAAPFLSGIVASSGAIFIGDGYWATGVFALAAAVGYWTRNGYLLWQEVKCAP